VQSAEPTSARIRILFVHHRPELGGAPSSLSYLIASLDHDAFEPHVYTPRGPAAQLFEQAGATVHTGPVSSFTHIWASIYRGRRWLLFVRELMMLGPHLAALWRVMRETQFDVVHLNDSPLVAAAFLARRARVPIVWHLRSALPGTADDLRSRVLKRVIRRLATETIAINSDVAQSFATAGTVVSNAVDLERFRPGDSREVKETLDIPPDRPIVGFFGFIYPSKGFREFIEAAAAIRSKGIEATYLLVGGAVRGDAFFRTPHGWLLERLDLARNYEAEARELVAELGLTDDFRFVPFTRETADLYRASDVVVAPSRGPELGRPVLEAAATGVPVVASGSRTGALILIPGETGLLLPSSESGDIADAVSTLLQDDARRRAMGAAARQLATEQFDAARTTRRVEEIYRRAARRTGRTPVLYVHHRPQLGGAPASLAGLIRELDERFEPHVFCPEGLAADLFRAAGAEVHTGPVAIFSHAWDSPYGGLRWLVLGREVAALPSHIVGLRALLRSRRFPIVHLNDSPLLVAGMLAHRHGAKVVWHLRSALAGDGKDRRARVIAGLIDRWGDRAIAIDEDVAERFPISIPISIVHNTVRWTSAEADTDEVRRSLGLPTDRVLVGFAGFVRRQKGWPELVQAARILEDANVRVHFVIIGGGIRPPAYFRTPQGRLLQRLDVVSDEESAINDLVRKNRLEHRFSFLPFTPDTADVYRSVDVVAFPNQGIGLGRPVLEAAAYGKPVVASGSRDGAGVLLPEVTGILLPEPSPPAIAKAIQRLAEDAQLRARMGAAAVEHAHRSFDPKANARAVEALYDGLLGPPPSRRASAANGSAASTKTAAAMPPDSDSAARA
jgi:glycosyltransferase involved in cell wall biosynthesis